jgi:uncharacterized protein Usg
LKDFELALNGYILTTAEIIYHLPDYPDVLQSFILQQMDDPNNFPRLHRFIVFWQKEIDGRLHSVRVVCADNLAVPKLLMPGFFETIH